MHRLKENPYNGLYTFSLGLGKSLAAGSQSTEELWYYIPKDKFGFFGNKVSYVAQRSLDKYYQFRTSRFDVWHATTDISWYKPFNRKTKFILTLHDLNFLLEDKSNTSRNRRLLKRIQNRVDRADFIAGISQYTLDTASQHLQLGNTPRKVIYNGCNINDFQGYDSPGYRPSRPFLFTIGLVQPRKNFHLLPSLLKDNDYELVIAGLDHFDYKQKIEEGARRWNVSDRVKLTGAISEPDKYWYYKNCLAFVFPSYAEGFGLPVIEAMYHGKPVFLSKETCLPEIGGDAAYYFDSFDPAAMQDTFRKGMQDFRLGVRITKLKQRAASFSWDKAAAEYLGIYRTV
jgi:glycosyltransferase involved in cell wall biosynthesis